MGSVTGAGGALRSAVGCDSVVVVVPFVSDGGKGGGGGTIEAADVSLVVAAGAAGAALAFASTADSWFAAAAALFLASLRLTTALPTPTKMPRATSAAAQESVGRARRASPLSLAGTVRTRAVVSDGIAMPPSDEGAAGMLERGPIKCAGTATDGSVGWGAWCGCETT